jgi:3-oxoacyl-[acyl-carrier-protein] synthase-3
MNYSRVYIDSLGYELAPVVVTSQELEERLRPLYQGLRIPEGQLEALTGIVERRWWEAGFPVSQGAVAAARKALNNSQVPTHDIDTLIYAGVCREQFEPATACRVAADLGISPNAAVYDISNACLGVLNGILDIANRIELGQIRAGMVVSCETAREITDIVIDRMLESQSMEVFKNSLATLTGGSGAVAVILTDGSYSAEKRRRLLGGVTQAAPEYYGLCRWGIEVMASAAPPPVADLARRLVDEGSRLGRSAIRQVTQFMNTDSISVMKYGVALGMRTWSTFLRRIGWMREQIDKVICHQVGASHRDAILKALGIPIEKDFSTFEYLGNIGTVSLPLTAALAEERNFLKPGDHVGFLGIGSGLNCLMLGIDW